MAITLRGPPSTSMRIAALAVTTGIVASALLSSTILSRIRLRMARASLRSQLPRTIEEWSIPRAYETYAGPLWNKLDAFFKERGYILWQPYMDCYFSAPREIEPVCNGFAFAPLHRGWPGQEGNRLKYLLQIFCPNPKLRPARTKDGRDVVIRALCAGSEGKDHLNILLYVARGPCSQATPNHAVPLYDLIELEDITFGIFPRVGFSMLEAYDGWAENSAGDIVDMILQCLEALGFMHSIGVAHRDAFKDNFLVQWFPESLGPRQLTIGRPRVFLNDFETAVRFDNDTPSEQRTCVGPPLCPSFALPERYFRPIPTEVSSGDPYDPFKLDVWQFGASLKDFKTGIPEIDSILVEMTEEDPVKRISAFDALKRLSGVVRSMSAERLDIAPIVTKYLAPAP